jgi:hypothetical protein
MSDRRPFGLSEDEAEYLDRVLEQHLEGLEHVNPAVCQDPSIGDWDTLLEVTADTDRETNVLKALRGRINEFKRTG